MNLAILIGRFPPGVVGGAELQAGEWARRLAERHGVAVITRKNAPGDAPVEVRDGFTVVRLPVARLPLVRTALDVARIHGAVRALAPRPDRLLCFQTFLSGWAGVRIGRRLGIPAIVWVRGEDEYRPNSRTSRFSVPTWLAAEKVLVQTESNREHVLAAVRRFHPSAEPAIEAKLRVVPNGLALPDAREAAAPGKGGILAVGRLIRVPPRSRTGRSPATGKAT